MSREPRAFDHLVLAVADLEAAAAAYERLGFTVSARGVHPWGTWNRLVQLADRTFLELLTVGEPDKIVEPGPDGFSFGAFNRDFLRQGEGMSMLVLASRDARADLDGFAAEGLRTFAPFDFERVARAPDGSERKVAFTLAFTADPALPRAGFFTCEHKFPESFWRAELQRHANGASGIAAVTMVAQDPADHHVFLTRFTGCRDFGSTGYGLSFALANGRLDVLSGEAFRHRFGHGAEASRDARFRAITLRVPEHEALAARFAAAGIAHRMAGGLVVTDAIHGLSLAFSA